LGLACVRFDHVQLFYNVALKFDATFGVLILSRRRRVLSAAAIGSRCASSHPPAAPAKAQVPTSPTVEKSAAQSVAITAEIERMQADVMRRLPVAVSAAPAAAEKARGTDRRVAAEHTSLSHVQI